MPPTDNTPDFDSMSPEELMAWMETLAERQGAHEGFTTDKRVDIDEVDPDTVQDSGPGYIPYGMTEEQWAQRQAEEEAKKAERRAQQQEQQPSAPAPAPVPVPATPEPEPTPAAPAASSGDAPDFDSMSPEELMAWMETLAERQGAHEGFTTDKRVDIAEVDPDTVQDSGPGYIPYGMTEEQWAQRQAEEEAKKAERRAQQQTPPPSAPTPQPATPEPATPEPEPTFDLPQFDTSDLVPAEDFTPTNLESGGDGLGWLEDLAADTGQGDFPQMDLSGLGDDVGGGLDLSALSDEPEEDTDPMAWLDNLAQGGAEEPQFDMSFASGGDDAPPVVDDEPEAVSAFDGDNEDPMNWLESLAREQGADPSEFTTGADLDVSGQSAPMPNFDLEETEDVIDFPDDIDALDEVDMADEADPVAWLEGLASSQSDSVRGFDDFEMDEAPSEEKKDEASLFANDPLVQAAKGDNVMDALSRGDVSADDMRGWMDNLLSQGVQRSDEEGFQIPEEEGDDDSMPVADIPDWLVDQVGPPPETLQTDEPQPEPPAFVETISEPEAVQDIPDWLKEEVSEQEDSLENIFAQEAEEEETVFDAGSGFGDSDTIDTSDPWVEAFEMERTGKTPEFITEAFDEGAPAAGAVELQEASLPQASNLPAGELVPLPGWVDTNELAASADAMPVQEPQAVAPSSPPVVSEVEAVQIEDEDLPDWLREMDTQDEMDAVVSEELPDWLKEAGVSDTDNVPDWLKDTITLDGMEAVDADVPADIFEPVEEQQLAPTPPAPKPAAQPQPTPQREVVPAASPAPVTATMSLQEAGAALQNARTKLNDGDMDAALEDYEAVIRANVQLEAVVGDLRKVVQSQKQNAAAHRVLGDGLMRLGNLQEALDTYRKALNLL